MKRVWVVASERCDGMNALETAAYVGVELLGHSQTQLHCASCWRRGAGVRRPAVYVLARIAGARRVTGPDRLPMRVERQSAYCAVHVTAAARRRGLRLIRTLEEARALCADAEREDERVRQALEELS